MAAILCNGIGDCMRIVCRTLDQVVCLPCRLCGCVCDNLWDVIASPFFFFFAVVLGTNVPPLVMAVQANALWGHGGAGNGACGQGLLWLLVNGGLCAANICAALYVVGAIQRSRIKFSDPLIRDTRENSFSRVTQILCYDPCFALYLVVLLVFTIWQSMGISKIIAMGAEGGCDGIRSQNLTSLICGYLFLSLTAVAFICSVCCMKVQSGLPH
jgi:hypothetical protein